MFFRVDMTMVGANQRKTLVVLQRSKNKPQRFVTGNNIGQVRCAKIKKGHCVEEWKVSPKTLSGLPVTALSLGGPPEKREFVFAAYGQNILGLKKNSKEVCLFNTSLNEDIHNMYVESHDIYTTCEYVVNTFTDFTETQFYMTPDKVNDFLTLSTHEMILACQDSVLRVLKGSDLVCQTRVRSPVNALVKFTSTLQEQEDGNFAKTKVLNQLAYGTDTGELGTQVYANDTLVPVLDIKNPELKGAISVLHAVDFLQTGIPDLVVGRDDGLLEILSVQQDATDSLKNMFKSDFNESINGLASGCCVNLSRPDLLVETYSGKVLALNTDTANNPMVKPKESKKQSTGFFGFGKKSSSAASAEASPANPNDSEAVTSIKAEIAELQAALAVVDNKYKAESKEVIAVQKLFTIKQKMRLVPEESCYLISLEIQLPLDIVIVQADVPVLLLDVDREDATVSHTTTDEKDGSALLATFRCNGSKRLEFKVRTSERQAGKINVFVIPKANPRSCQRAQFNVKPLSLHKAIDAKACTATLATRETTTLSVAGDFTLNQMHAWVADCFPNVPPRISTETGAVSFENVFLGSLVQCTYAARTATFVSDSVSTISILADVITKAATHLRVDVRPTVDVNDNSISGFLELVKPRIDSVFTLKRKNELIGPLRELQAQSDDVSFMSEEFRDILQKSQQIQIDYRQSPMHQKFLQNMLVDLYTNKYKLKGRRPKQHQELLDLLAGTQYTFQKLVELICD